MTMYRRIVLAGWVVLTLLASTELTSVHAAERLRNEASPYLRLHADDLVDWRVWGEAAKAEAAALDRPILLSIGYLACHWCHVMRRESFANPAIAKLINENFIPILIDREQRPDVDDAYQRAAVIMELPTGWPLTMFLTADGKPFWGGTYFPPERMAGLPSFPEILTAMADVYIKDRDAINRSGDKVIAAITLATRITPGELTVTQLNAAAIPFMAESDIFEGGFGTAPKFPYLSALEFLWRHHLRTGDVDTGDQVILSLRKMLAGGFYDHIGGGFFRYATDNAWRVPHYEKMLDGNAQLLTLMVEVWRETADPLLRKGIEGTALFLLRDMRLENDAFAASLDADSENAQGEEEEGAHYIWQPEDIHSVLGDRATRFLSVFGLQPPEYQDGHGWGTPYRRDGQEETPVDELIALLHKVRNQRAQPRRDEKIIGEWNAYAVRALTEAGLALDKPEWITAAQAAFDTTNRLLRTGNGEPAHSIAFGRVSGLVQLAGLGQLADAAISLFETGAGERYLDDAEFYLETALRAFKDDDVGGFFETHVNQPSIVVRTKISVDSPNPSGNAALISAMARLYHLRGGERWRQAIERSLRAFGGVGTTPDLEYAGLMNAAETYLRGLQIVLIGETGDPGLTAMTNLIGGTSAPGKTLSVLASTQSLPDTHPAAGKTRIDDRATAYVCKGTFCSLPVTGPEDLLKNIKSLRRD